MQTYSFLLETSHCLALLLLQFTWRPPCCSWISPYTPRKHTLLAMCPGTDAQGAPLACCILQDLRHRNPPRHAQTAARGGQPPTEKTTDHISSPGNIYTHRHHCPFSCSCCLPSACLLLSLLRLGRSSGKSLIPLINMQIMQFCLV